VLEVDGNRIEQIAVTFIERPQRRESADGFGEDEDEIQ
jgi:hypothetical protein